MPPLFQIQVILDDAKVKTGVFSTAQRGALPPLVTTEFVVQDQGMSCGVNAA